MRLPMLQVLFGSKGFVFRVVSLRPVPNCRAFSLVELLIVVAILGLLTAIAYPAYRDYVDRTDVYQASQDIAVISASVLSYKAGRGKFPDSLAQIGMSMDDPWGNPYRYLRIDGATKSGKGKARKDKNLVPINSDFDLYSAGKDGATVGPLTAKPSHDDIVRANNGGFIGLAINY